MDYVEFHFGKEEEMFKGKNLESADEHCAKHAKFVEDCKAAKAVDDGTMNFIKQWLVDHIKISDMKYKGL